MGLSLKNEETERLARELARHTGESLTLAVTLAVKERLERQRNASKREGRLERIMKIAERTAPLFKDRRPSKELFEDLYDETGLPK